MLAYISIGIALCSITACLVVGLTWAYLYDDIRHSSLLQEEFHATVRWMIVSIGVFVIPVVVYFLDAGKQSVSNVEPYAFVWVAFYVVSVLFLSARLIIMIRDANRESKTGHYRFRR
jgi:hypothetical protein